ncbi:HD domain-containing protein [Mangrovicoccus algicola]|uniref:Bifunctional (P)ppGpp synthetase/guanosine-3',5'-bis(Diphosphate) 3'-pyrophosphohydrolase n=1 Tax=Mangrovicoccus algicola TaxID=2771008 RepID=A0A8J6Z185_9RHOB|nr:HD domain-containing protein [Mangrovicoccus algicola]MBE3639651.1 bifunctional (p)ppGpp synthetase/guanosine-3',5'-bis(diphosphate) 3'-pyrophosphohydrolase [Mangrovicoccus algicola]
MTETAGLLDLSRALVFASRAHANQRRKGAAQEPYVNHLIEVMDLVARTTDAADVDLMVAALMHDVLEDTPVTPAELSAAFGARVTRIVGECSDDMSLPKAARRAERLASMPGKSREARIVKTADVISNIRAVVLSAPAGWTAERKLAYLADCRALVAAGAEPNAHLQAIFERTAADAEAAIRKGGSLAIDGVPEAVHELENTIGQPVHKVYMANTSARPLTEEDLQHLGRLIASQFPSGTIEKGHAVYDGRMREVFLAYIRTDSPSAIVSFAQRVCLEFEQSFAGIEVGGRYIRVYADDTG